MPEGSVADAARVYARPVARFCEGRAGCCAPRRGVLTPAGAIKNAYFSEIGVEKWDAAGQVGEVLSAEKEILFEDAEWLLARATPFAPLSLHPRPPPCLRAFLPTILFPISPPLHLQVASGPCNVRVCRVGGAPCWA